MVGLMEFLIDWHAEGEIAKGRTDQIVDLVKLQKYKNIYLGKLWNEKGQFENKKEIDACVNKYFTSFDNMK